MECSLVGRSIAEEADGNLAALIIPGRQSRACGKWETAAHDAVRAKHAFMDIRDMHGAALAPARSGFSPQQFRHHCAHVHTFGNAMAVAAMMTGDKVVIGQASADADRDRFFASVKMHKARHFSGGEL